MIEAAVAPTGSYANAAQVAATDQDDLDSQPADNPTGAALAPGVDRTLAAGTDTHDDEPFAALGVPRVDLSIAKTLDRSKLWEMQTPQVIKPDLLKEGFKLVNEKGYEVTDDVSIVEFMGEGVQITEGSYVNIKVTTPEDMFIAERLLNEQGVTVSA